MGVPDDDDVIGHRAAGVFERDRSHDVEVEAVALAEIEALLADKDGELSLQQRQLLCIGASSPGIVGHAPSLRQVDHDDFNAAGRALRRGVTPPILGFRIAPDGLVGLAGEALRRTIGEPNDAAQGDVERSAAQSLPRSAAVALLSARSMRPIMALLARPSALQAR